MIECKELEEVIAGFENFLIDNGYKSNSSVEPPNSCDFLPNHPDESGLWLVHELASENFSDPLDQWKEHVISQAIKDKDKDKDISSSRGNDTNANPWAKYRLLSPEPDNSHYQSLWETADGWRQYCIVQPFIGQDEDKIKSAFNVTEEEKVPSEVIEAFLPHTRHTMRDVVYYELSTDEDCNTNDGYICKSYLLHLSKNFYFKCQFYSGFCHVHSGLIKKVKFAIDGKNPEKSHTKEYGGIEEHGDPYFFLLVDTAESFELLKKKEMLVYQYQQINDKGRQAPQPCDDKNSNTVVFSGVRGVVMVNNINDDSPSIGKLFDRPVLWTWLLAIHQRVIAEHLAKEAVDKADNDSVDVAKALQKDVLYYESTWMYHQIASNISRDKLFKCFSEVLDIKEMWEDVREQHEARAVYIQSEHDKAQLEQDRKLTDSINLLMVLAIPLTVLGALLAYPYDSNNAYLKMHYHDYLGFVMTAIVGTLSYGAVKLLERLPEEKRIFDDSPGLMSISSMGGVALYWWGNVWILSHFKFFFPLVIILSFMIIKKFFSVRKNKKMEKETKQQYTISFIVIISIVLMIVFIEYFS